MMLVDKYVLQNRSGSTRTKEMYYTYIFWFLLKIASRLNAVIIENIFSIK